jgi:hypothetical protein
MTRRPLHIFAWILAGAVGLAAFLWLGRHLGMLAQPTCLIYLLTGVSCPGCGMTRATACLARGDLMSALQFHPLAPLLLLEVIVGWGWWGLVVLRRVRMPSAWWLIGTVAIDGVALLLTWIVRFATGTLP